MNTQIVNEIRKAVEAAIEDANELGIEPTKHIERLGHKIRITTRETRNSGQSRNGGDYEYWTDFYIQGDKLVVQNEWSAEFNPEQFLGEALEFPACELSDIYNTALQMIASK